MSTNNMTAIKSRMENITLDTDDARWQSIVTSLEHDIYQLPEYVGLEGLRTGTQPKAFVSINGDKIFFVPYLIRSCQELASDIYDVISPYGYPGILLSDAAKQDADFCTNSLQSFQDSLKTQNICSGFFRLHPILNEGIEHLFPEGTLTNNGGTVSIDLTLPKEQVWSNTKSNHRNKINRCTKRFNLTAKISKFDQGIEEFCSLYEETMSRVTAQNIYYSFNTDYFKQMAEVMSDYLYLCLVETEHGEPASAGLYTVCDGIVQAAFGGISDEFVKQSPSMLEIDSMRWWAQEQGYKYLHLGGGVGGSQDDGVFKFKAAFSKLQHSFQTLRLVCDREKYQKLVALKAQAKNTEVEELENSGFFPAYRA